MSTLWMTIEPRGTEMRLQMTEAGRGPVLRARMPLYQAHPQALARLLPALSDWYGRPLAAVLDADAQDVGPAPDVLRPHAGVTSTASASGCSGPAR